MENQLKLKYGDFFKDLLVYEKALFPCLELYLKTYSIEMKKGELISLIHQVKEISKKKLKQKIKQKHRERFCQLIEKIVTNFEDEDLNNGILDNYGIFQLYLSSIISHLAKESEDMKINSKLIKSYFAAINNFIQNKYGEEYLELIERIGLLKINEPKDITSQTDAIYKASIIIQNMHSNELNKSISAYILSDYNKFEKYNVNFPEINPCKLDSFKEDLKHLNKLFIIINRMEKYPDKNRLSFFREFKGQNGFLDSINIILCGMNKAKLLNLNDEIQDAELTKEFINLLKEENKDLSSENKKLKYDLEVKINEVNNSKNEISSMETIITDLQKKINGLKINLSEKNKELKEKENNYNSLFSQLALTSQKLNDTESKINYFRHREFCGKIEYYFFNILSSKGKLQINEELKNTNTNKIDLLINKINEEYPNYFKQIANKGIDYQNFLYKVNNFRIKNNEDCHDKTNIDLKSIVKALNDFYENDFDFEKHIKYMVNNFEYFEYYLLNDKFFIDDRLYTIFQQKEKNL